MEETIDLKNIIRILYKGLKWLVICTLLGVLIMFVISQFVMTPKYKSDVSLYVTNTDSSNNLNVNDINASQKLIETYIVILEQDEVMAQVANEVALTMPWHLQSGGQRHPDDGGQRYLGAEGGSGNR